MNKSFRQILFLQTKIPVVDKKRFTSLYKKICDPLAHPVEHSPFKAGVPRSSRGWVTNFRADGEMVDALVLGTSGETHGGSSPLPPILPHCAEFETFTV